MIKSFMLTALSLMLSIKASSQSKGGIEEYFYVNEQSGFDFVPLAYLQNSKNWYFEGRYNFEAPNTFSLYAGKIFEKESALSYSLNPVAGVIMGGLQGGSAGLNMDMAYKKCFFSSQSQYTFSLKEKRRNFFYSWSELGYDFKNYLSGGVSLQHTKGFNTVNKFDKGIFFKVRCNRWTFPLYAFLNENNRRYYIISLAYEWSFRKITKNTNNR